MGFFKKNRKKDQGKSEKESVWIESLPLDAGNWNQVFSACLGKMTAIQTACGEQVVQEQEWHVDFSNGVIFFGDQGYPLQLIGSESASSNTWLWGWENVNGLPDSMLQLAMRTKTIGERLQLDPLTIAQFSLDDIFNGHALSVVACGLSDRYCYYRCPHSGGSVFVAFSDAPDEVFSSIDAQKFVTLTMQCIQQFDIDHRVFIEGFLTWNHTSYDWDNQTLFAHFQKDLKIAFERTADNALRICSMDTGFSKA